MDNAGRFIHSHEAFASILQLERNRSDRSGAPFSLVVFDVASDDKTAELAATLQQSLRATDQIGCIGTQLGVILWHTAAHGARKFLEKTQTRANSALPGSRLYVYPDAECRGETETPDCSRDDDNSDDVAGFEAIGNAGQTTAVAAPAQAVVSSEVRIENALSLTEELVQELVRETQTAPAVAQSMNAFFERPMPFWKRTIDVVGAVCGLIVLSPLLLTVAAAIRCTSRGPIIFRQRRAGRGGRPFKMYKFRSMVVDAEEKKKELLAANEQDGPAFKMEHDPRITPIGHLIRKTSIDELPQLWNVLKGDMSLVGPRPLPCSEADACEPWQKRRLEVTPGLTCIWQVPDPRTNIPFADWARMSA